MGYFIFITLIFFLAVLDRHVINTPQTHGLLGNFLAPAIGLCLVSFPFAFISCKKAWKENKKFETVILGSALLPGILLLLLVCAYTIGLN